MSVRRNHTRRFLPGFIPGSLYVALVRHPITSPSAPATSASSTSSSIDNLAFFYQKSPTTPQLGPSTVELHEVCVQVRYWCLVPMVGLRQGSISAQVALVKEDVLGFVRVAESVDPRILDAVTTQNVTTPEDLDSFCAERYIFNALDRLRKLCILRSYIWDFGRFQNELKALRKFWEEEAAKAEAAQTSKSTTLPKYRPFTEFRLCDFDSQEHPTL